MTNKVFIIYHNKDLIKPIIEYINNETNDISISKKFISDEESNDGTYYYLSQNTLTYLKINLS